MKLILYSFLLLIVCSCHTAKLEQAPTLFRHVNLYSNGRFELGDSLNKIEPLTEVLNNRIFLKKPFFGGADSIEIIPNPDGKISSIIFKYSNETNFPSEVNDYKKWLGKPMIIQKKAIWKDATTQFEIYEQDGTVYSKMIDLKNT